MTIFTYLLYCILLLIFICIAALYLHFPGFYYDEVLFYNAAVGAPTDLFIYRKLFHVPIMLMPYIGALKAWIYMPIFYFFDTNYYSVRLPSIIIVAVSLFVFIYLVHNIFGAPVAILSTIMFISNPSIIFHARLDWGPTSLMLLFRNLMFLYGYLFTQHRKPSLLIAAGFFAALGVFDKLNFVWLLNSFFVTLFVVEYLRVQTYKHYFRKFAQICLILLCFFLILFLILTLYNPTILKFSTYINLSPSINSLVYASNMLADSINGVGIYGLVFRPQRLQTGFETANLAIILFCSIFALVPRKHSHDDKYFSHITIWLGCLIMTLLQIYITSQATGPHHYAALLPVVDVLCILGLYNIYFILESKKILGLTISGALFFSLVIYRSWIIYIYIIDFTLNTPSPYWDKYIDKTAEYILHNYPLTPVITTDWGIATNLQAATSNRVHVNDFWPWFNDGMSPTQMTWFIETYFRRGSLVIKHVDGRESFVNTSRNFNHFISDTRIIHQLVSVIATQDNSPYIEIYFIQHKTAY